MSSIFLSYSHKDEIWKDRLKTHLGVLDSHCIIDAWDDRQIEGGSDWFEEIHETVTRASVVILLISADFLRSKFILHEKFPRLLQGRRAEGLSVIPVIVRPCAWGEVKWLKSMHGRPKGGKALVSFKGDGADQELTKIAKEIREILLQETETRASDRQRKPLLHEDDFLDRVEAVCRLHEPDAEIQRYPGIGAAGGYLRVVRRIGAIRDIYPVGSVESSLSRESFETFLSEIDAPYRRNDPGLISFLVYGGAPAPVDIAMEAGARRVHIVSFVEYQGLIDFRTYLKKQTEKLINDPIYPPSLYVPQRMRNLSLQGSKADETEDALAQVREWLASPHGRFLVLLGDFGTGKTFLLHELARRMAEAKGGLIPILLQMRSLEKGRTLDALLAQHFAQNGMEGFSPARFRYMLEQGRIALLFDGFDELALRVTYAKATDHFSTLLQAATGNAKVVLTSRRQHFLSESQVKTALAERVESLAGHRLSILQPFRREQVRIFLVNLFAGDTAKAESRLDLIDRVKDLLGLSSNPRLLGFIAELPEDKLEEACAKEGEITAAKLYELLLTRWLEYEFDRVHPRGAPPGLSVAERWQAVTLLAMRLWQKTDRSVNLADLNEEAARVVQVVGPAAPDSEVAAFQVGSGTLLVRDAEGNFAFLHQSILEWLVARSAAEALIAGAHPEALVTREISPLMADFFASLAGPERAVAWARRILSNPAVEAAKKNALLVLGRQRAAIRIEVELINQNLQGRDLSGQDLSGVDLSGSDLSESQLVGTILDSARLVGATLREANLSMASLAGADLTEADLTGARLNGANLRGAQLIRASLRRAKLLAAALDADSLTSADVSGAALDLSGLSPKGSAAGQQAVVWSPAGDLLVSAAGELIRLWDAKTWREIRAFNDPKGSVMSLAFSPDGSSIASGSDNHTIRLWHVDRGSESRALIAHQGEVWSVAFSPNGKSLASGSNDHTVRLWHVGSGIGIKTFTGHQNTVWSVAFSPDGKSLASCSNDKTVRLWRVDSGRKIRAFVGHQDGVLSVAFSPDGKSLASGSDDHTVRLWQVDSEREIRTFTGHQKTVWSVAFSPNGKSIASGSDDYTVRLWRVNDGRKIRTLTGHQDGVRSVAFSPNGTTLASGSLDGTIRLWNVADGRCLAVLLPLPEGWVAYSPDGRYKFGGVPAGGFWHAANLCRFEIGELDEWVPGLRLADDASFFDLPPWTPEVRVPSRAGRE